MLLFFFLPSTRFFKTQMILKIATKMSKKASLNEKFSSSIITILVLIVYFLTQSYRGNKSKPALSSPFVCRASGTHRCAFPSTYLCCIVCRYCYVCFPAYRSEHRSKQKWMENFFNLVSAKTISSGN